MFYATWSRGFRPGGINRRADIPPYDADFLTNYELGWKTTLGPAAVERRDLSTRSGRSSSSAFLGANSFTEIHNGRDARINGVETDVNYVARRPDLECGRRLHRRQDQGGDLHRRVGHDAGLAMRTGRQWHR